MSRLSGDPLLIDTDAPLSDLVIALAVRVATAPLVEAQRNSDRRDDDSDDDDEKFGQGLDTYREKEDADNDDDHDDYDDDDEIEDDPCGAPSDSDDEYVSVAALIARVVDGDKGFGSWVGDGNDRDLAACAHSGEEERDNTRGAHDDDHAETFAIVDASVSEDQTETQSDPDAVPAEIKEEDRNEDDDEDDHREDDHLLRAEILSKCPSGGHKHASHWQPMIDNCIDALARCDPAQDACSSRGDGDDDNAPHQEAAAVLCRFLPTLAAYDFDVYQVDVHLENAGHIGRIWDDDGWLAEAYCGTGDWLLRVACRRTRIYDKRTGPERPGGSIRLDNLVHRRHHGKPAPYVSAALGDGYNRYTHELLAFMRSGQTSLPRFVDTCYGPLKRAARVLCRRFGWSIKGARDNNDDCEDIWDDRSFTYNQSSEFVRASDGAAAVLAWHEGSLFVCGSGIEPTDVAPSLHGAMPLDQEYGLTVPRPPNAYDTSIQYERLAHEREHADRAYLVRHGLLDPMHAAPLGRLPKRKTSTTATPWPCVQFPYDPYTWMDADAEADWHRRLAARMDYVADLAERGPMGDLFISGNDMRAAMATASPRVAAVAVPALRRATRFDTAVLDSMIKVMLSPVLSSTWSINAPADHMRYGSRYVDAARGLYVNWSLRCNFVSCVEALGLVYPRFYGHLLVLDQHKSTEPSEATPAPSDATPCLNDSPTAPLTVVAYYALTLRDPEAFKSRSDHTWSTHRIATLHDTDSSEREAIDEAIAALNPALRSRFGRDEPHHVIDHYRRREFEPVPAGAFCGIVQEDALDVGPTATPAIAIARAFDWLCTAFERHAAVFGVAR
ncbi:hypothetical protein pkur_cds_589 [Pandoravirus kuranda]|uniref:Uncharacterized protein n=1 Tax=Pandoravirus kuranda TaxID=3019033 RepID=A0AA95EH25_9VIRU|nr:hypothetical protein pkur_cds_589 [Pandoravirus kuranda]